MYKIKVLLVEDHTVVRQGLRNLLERESDIEVIGEAQNGRIAVKKTIELKPDIIIMDIAMPLLNGFEATKQISKEIPGTKIIILSAHGGDEYLDHIMSLGASGYLLKQSSFDFLFKAIREVHKGKTFFSPSILKRIQEQREKAFTRSGLPNKKKIVLSFRENEVLQLIVESKVNKEMASELGISIKTIEKHRQSLMNKLNIHNVAGLTRYAITEGIIENNKII